MDITSDTSIKQFCSHIVENILADISNAYPTISTPIEQDSIMIIEDQSKAKHSVLELAKKIGLDVHHTQQFNQAATGESIQLTHYRVLQQFVPNICGYHASYNMLIVLDALKYSLNNTQSTERNVLEQITSSGSFWKFHLQTMDFLWQYKLKNEAKNDKFPWREKDIRNGDFERTYLKLSLKHLPRFGCSLSSISDSIRVEYATWEYQFNRSILSDQDHKDLSQKLSAFVNFNIPDESFVLAMMLGITNHWMSLIAHKRNGHIEFIFLDSRNRNYLEWDEATIKSWIEEQKLKRQSLGLAPWSDFDILVQKQCVQDIQNSIRLLCDCMLGNTKFFNGLMDIAILEFETQFHALIANEDSSQEQQIEFDTEEITDQAECFANDFSGTIEGFLLENGSLSQLSASHLSSFRKLTSVFDKVQALRKQHYQYGFGETQFDTLYDIIKNAKE